MSNVLNVSRRGVNKCLQCQMFHGGGGRQVSHVSNVSLRGVNKCLLCQMFHGGG